MLVKIAANAGGNLIIFGVMLGVVHPAFEYILFLFGAVFRVSLHWLHVVCVPLIRKLIAAIGATPTVFIINLFSGWLHVP